MQVINLVIDAIVFAVGTLSAERSCLESGIFDSIIVRFLWSPRDIVSQIMNFNIGFFESLDIRGK